MDKKFLRRIYEARQVENVEEADDFADWTKRQGYKSSPGELPDRLPGQAWKVKQRQSIGSEPSKRRTSVGMMRGTHGGSERSPSGIWHNAQKAAIQHKGAEKAAARKGKKYVKPDPYVWPKTPEGWKKYMKAVGKDPNREDWRQFRHSLAGGAGKPTSTAASAPPQAPSTSSEPLPTSPSKPFDPKDGPDIKGSHGGKDWAERGQSTEPTAKKKTKLGKLKLKR